MDRHRIESNGQPSSMGYFSATFRPPSARDSTKRLWVTCSPKASGYCTNPQPAGNPLALLYPLIHKKGKKRATSGGGNNNSSGSDKKPAKKTPAEKKGKKRAATSQGGKAKKRYGEKKQPRNRKSERLETITSGEWAAPEVGVGAPLLRSTVVPTPNRNVKRLETITSREGAPHEVGGKGEGGKPVAKDMGKPTTVGETGGGYVGYTFLFR